MVSPWLQLPAALELSLSSACSHRPPPLGQALQQAPQAHIIVPVPSLQTAPPQAALAWLFKAKPQPPHAAHPFSSRTVSRFLGAPSASSLLGGVSPAPRASRPVSPPPVRITVRGAPGTLSALCSHLYPREWRLTGAGTWCVKGSP